MEAIFFGKQKGTYNNNKHTKIKMVFFRHKELSGSIIGRNGIQKMSFVRAQITEFSCGQIELVQVKIS